MTFDSFTKGLLDRFGHLLPPFWQRKQGYEISFPSKNEIASFGVRLGRDLSYAQRSHIRTITRPKFIHETIGKYRLPLDFSENAVGGGEYAARAWWQERYLLPARAELDFTMINRLVELLVRANPDLKRALRSTYPFVFVDEFQDTTAAQMGLLDTVFNDPEVVTTVVGDGKQRIMEFAGAVDNAMSHFDRAFSAHHFDLLWNFRSSSALVDAQHDVALQLDASTRRTESKSLSREKHVPVSLWTFEDLESQAGKIAKWVSRDMAESGRVGSDYAILSRAKIGEFESGISSSFASLGVAVRNDDRKYGELALQVLLAHDFTVFVIGMLRLAVHPTDLPEVWLETQRALKRLRGEPASDRAARRLADELQWWTDDLAEWLSHQEPSTVDASAVLERALGIVTQPQVESFIRGSGAGDSVVLLKGSFVKRLEEAQEASGGSWAEVLDYFLATEAVPMMTIHKSKGLEFHTVFVLALEDSNWFGMRYDQRSEFSTLFVALSRAARRVIFTSINPGARVGNLRPFYEVLDGVGMEYSEWV